MAEITEQDIRQAMDRLEKLRGQLDPKHAAALDELLRVILARKLAAVIEGAPANAPDRAG